MKNKNQHRVFRILQPNNKKADIPVTVLVIGVILICTLAIFSFLASSFNTRSSFVGIEIMEKMNSKIDEYHFYQNIGVSSETIERVLEIEDAEIYLEKNTPVFWSKDRFRVSVTYALS